MARWLPWTLMIACGDPRTLDDDGDWTSWGDAPTGQREAVRVANWNVESLGAVGDDGWTATRNVLARLDADVVGLNEIVDVDIDALHALADELGYPLVLTHPDQPYGDLGNAVLSRLEEIQTTFPSAADLSGDGRATDLTRLPVVHVARLPSGEELTFITEHWKSGFEPADELRRTIDGVRVAQAAASRVSSDLLIVMGDVNEEITNVPGDPERFVSVPGGMPDDYTVGSDVSAAMTGDGLVHDPFAPLLDQGLSIVDCAQRDGTIGTRPSSGRRIDYAFVNAAVRRAGLSAEVYDSADDARPGIADGGEPPGYNDSNHASDHLPLLLEFQVTVE